MNRILNIFNSFEKIAEDLPPVEPSDRVKNIIMHKKAICPEMLGMETVGETGLEDEIEQKIEEEIPGADAEVVAKKVTTIGAPGTEEVEVIEEGGGSEDDKQSDVGELGAEFPPEKLEQLKKLIDEYTQYLEKAGAEIPQGKGIEDDDNQGDVEVPTQITKNSPLNTEPKGVSAKADQTEERKKTEDEQSGEHNEKVAGEVMRETKSEIKDLTDPSKPIPKKTSMAGLQAAQKQMQGKKETVAGKLGKPVRQKSQESDVDKAKASKDSYWNMRKGAAGQAELLGQIKMLSSQLGIIK